MQGGAGDPFGSCIVWAGSATATPRMHDSGDAVESNEGVAEAAPGNALGPVHEVEVMLSETSADAGHSQPGSQAASLQASVSLAAQAHSTTSAAETHVAEMYAADATTATAHAVEASARDRLVSALASANASRSDVHNAVH
jgi:hypothetical protein